MENVLVIFWSSIMHEGIKPETEVLENCQFVKHCLIGVHGPPELEFFNFKETMGDSETTTIWVEDRKQQQHCFDQSPFFTRTKPTSNTKRQKKKKNLQVE